MKKRILIILNYYSPYVSGLTEYARIEAEMLAKNGYTVAVLCSNHANLAREEWINGVHVYRAKVLMHISKGTVSTEFISMAKKLSRIYDVVNLHLPMLESGVISSFIPAEKLVVMYHCDVNLPSSPVNNFIVKTMDSQHNKALKKASAIIVTSEDYAAHSRVAAKYMNKVYGVAAPVKDYHHVNVKKNANQKVIGFCGRIVEEKGIDVLIKAFELVKKEIPEACLKIGGDYQSIAGGSVYPSLKKYIDDHKICDVEFLGKIPEKDMPSFFSGLDVFVLPSINSLEAFGMVQIEAMECGAPVVASDLYGVRTIVQNTKAGVICHRGDVKNLASCIIEVLKNHEKYTKELVHLKEHYSLELWYSNYTSVLIGEKR